MSLYYDKKLISGVRDVPSMTLAQYNALTNKPKLWERTDAPEGDRGINADDIEYDNGVSVKEKIDDIADYSETEKVVGKWIDGKPIYQKTVYFGTLPNNANKSVAHNVSNVKLWVDLCCVVTRSSDKVALFLPFVNTVNTIAYFSVTGNDIVITTNGNLSAYDDCYVTLKYTKTTD